MSYTVLKYILWGLMGIPIAVIAVGLFLSLRRENLRITGARKKAVLSARAQKKRLADRKARFEQDYQEYENRRGGYR